MKVTPVTTCMFVIGIALLAIGLIDDNLSGHVTETQVVSASVVGLMAGLAHVFL